jgi:hypothetical protein
VDDFGYRIGVAGAALGVVAGVVQWAAGDEIPEWTGNKLHPVQLGIITIVLSLMALGAITFLARRPGAAKRERILATVLIGLIAGICFTTVGRLWFVPGPLLLVSAVMLNSRRA